MELMLPDTLILEVFCLRKSYSTIQFEQFLQKLLLYQ